MTIRKEAKISDVNRGHTKKEDIYRFFGVINGEKLVKRFRNKRGNSAQRGIDFELTYDDLLTFGNKLLGRGKCDYSGVTFSPVAGNDMYPSIERINDDIGYVRGNIAIVTVRANMLKDYFFHQNSNEMSITISKKDKTLMKGIYSFMADKSEQKRVAEQYKVRVNVEKIKELKEPITKEEPVVTKQIQEEEKAPVSAVVELEQKTGAVSHHLPEDVVVARGYAGLATSMHNIGVVFEMTFAQYKAAYMTKRCPFTGRPIEGIPFAVVFDRTKPIAVGNICFTSEDIAMAVTNLLTATGGTLGDLTKNLKRLGA
ncbi:hypothetical protein [Burkholderia pseudomallei]|jgi:hypothetical protein|uniref:hypothetical protein n=1 Tax=Burkholderia pseudomallei TaxID=28450 RepID=UPI0024DFFE0E|nr:hypothetical protein [Burkholderia pseudomallei]